MRRITIFDTTLRDADQAAGLAFSPKDKPKIAVALAEAGVDIIEAGFPLSSMADRKACRDVLAALEGGTSQVSLMCRGNMDDIRQTATLFNRKEQGVLHITLPVSDGHIASTLHLTKSQLLKKAVQTVSFASELVSDVEMGAEDATRADVDFLCEYGEAVLGAGAATLNIADTLGVFSPPQMSHLFRTLRKRLASYLGKSGPSRKAKLSVHCHNDYGLAVANTLAAMESGGDQIEVTVGGLGERAGNAALEEVIANLDRHADIYHAVTGIRTDRLAGLAQTVCHAMGMALSPSKPILGWNVHAHASGIHQKGILHSEDSYSPEMLRSYGGIPERIVLSRHSGKAGITWAAKQSGLGELGEEVTRQLLNRVKQSESTTLGITEFLTLAVRSGLIPLEVPPPLMCMAFSEYHYDAYSRVMASLSDGRAVTGEGVTPEEAVLNAAKEILGLELRLTKWELNGTGGKYRVYLEIHLPGEELFAIERQGMIPGRLLFEGCLDVINCFQLSPSRF